MIINVTYENYCNGNLVKADGFAERMVKNNQAYLHPINDEILIYRYEDGEICDWNKPRCCPKCKMMPDKNGHDYCLGHLLGVTSACCGHGVAGGGYVIINEKKIALEEYKNEKNI